LRKIAEGIGERECKMMTEENTSEINIKRNTGRIRKKK
jgi:hypothetical protein